MDRRSFIATGAALLVGCGARVAPGDELPDEGLLWKTASRWIGDFVIRGGFLYLSADEGLIEVSLTSSRVRSCIPLGYRAPAPGQTGAIAADDSKLYYRNQQGGPNKVALSSLSDGAGEVVGVPSEPFAAISARVSGGSLFWSEDSDSSFTESGRSRTRRYSLNEAGSKSVESAGGGRLCLFRDSLVAATHRELLVLDSHLSPTAHLGPFDIGSMAADESSFFTVIDDELTRFAADFSARETLRKVGKAFGVRGLAVDANWVYFTDALDDRGPSLWAVSRSDGRLTMFAEGLPGVLGYGAIAIEGPYVYWFSSGSAGQPAGLYRKRRIV